MLSLKATLKKTDKIFKFQENDQFSYIVIIIGDAEFERVFISSVLRHKNYKSYDF